jgi:hypothetical protein
MVLKPLQDGYSTARTYVLPSNAIRCPANIDGGDRAFLHFGQGLMCRRALAGVEDVFCKTMAQIGL